MYKKKRLIIIIGVIIFALIIIFTAYTLWHLNKCTSNLLTEKDMLDAANDMAKNWSSTAYLVTIMVGGGYVECGEYHVTDMVYVYLDNVSVSKEGIRRGIEVIYEEGNFRIRNITWSPEVDRPLGTWDITCIEAYRIAKDNGEIRRLLRERPKPNISSFTLSNESGRPIWWIMIEGGVHEPLSPPDWVYIWIDAITGEVLGVEPGFQEGSYSICLVPLVIIISILLVILLSKSKRFTTFAATGFALFLLPALFLHIYYYSAIFTFMALVFGAVLWKGLEKYMGRDFLKSGDKKVVYGLFGLLAADYFGLMIARFLSISYSYPDLLWSSFIIINVAVLYMILSLTSEEEGTGKILRFFCR